MNSDANYIAGIAAFTVPAGIIAINFFRERHDLAVAIVSFVLLFLLGIFAVLGSIMSHSGTVKYYENEIKRLKEQHKAELDRERRWSQEYREKNRELLNRVEELSLADAGKLKLQNERLFKELSETEEKYYKQSDEYMQALDEIIDLKQERDAGLWQTDLNEEERDAELR